MTNRATMLTFIAISTLAMLTMFVVLMTGSSPADAATAWYMENQDNKTCEVLDSSVSSPKAFAAYMLTQGFDSSITPQLNADGVLTQVDVDLTKNNFTVKMVLFPELEECDAQLLVNSTPAPAPVVTSPQPVTHVWYEEDAQRAQCNALTEYNDDAKSPKDLIAELRSEGIVPDVVVKRDDTSSNDDRIVGIQWAGSNAQTVHLLLFTSVNSCTQQLNADIQSGVIVDPASLN